jgi:hypothetical protein
VATVSVRNIQSVDDGSNQTETISSTSSSAEGPKGIWLSISMTVLVVIGLVGMWLIFAHAIRSKPIKLTAAYVPFAGLIVVTAALERLLEPLSRVMGGTNSGTSPADSKAVAQEMGLDPTKTKAEVAEATEAAAKIQAAADISKSNRTIIFWAIASLCGLAISGGFGLFLLQPVASNHVNTFLDLGVTGLSIGAGTKPLHDLIASIQANNSSSS